MSRLTAKTLVATALVPLLAGPLAAQDYGDFDGYTLRVKLIGGAQYEPLYATISEWEAATGATVEILSRKNHFELDREIKQDIAAGTLNWCVGSNHTSFAPQYGNIYADLNELIAPEVLAEFVKALRRSLSTAVLRFASAVTLRSRSSVFPLDSVKPASR